MNVGVIFPQTECGSDVAAIGAFVRSVEAMGFDHSSCRSRAGRGSALSLASVPRHDSHERSCTSADAMRTSRRSPRASRSPRHHHPAAAATALVEAAAQIDVLTGRLRLASRRLERGRVRGAERDLRESRRRSAEQIAVLRALWTQPVVDFRGEFHRISHAASTRCRSSDDSHLVRFGSRDQPVPPDAALRLIARLADGWSPNFPPIAWPRLVARPQYSREAGRDPPSLPLRAVCVSRVRTRWLGEAVKPEGVGARRSSRSLAGRPHVPDGPRRASQFKETVR